MEGLLSGAGFNEKFEWWKRDVARTRAREVMDQHRQAGGEQAEEQPGIGESEPIHGMTNDE